MYGCDKICIASDEAVIFDHTAAFFDAVIVYGNCSASDICTFSDVGITDVCKVSDGCLFAYC